jgi:hypothetical protein
MQDVFENWIVLGGKDYHVKLFLFTIVLWGFWNARNKMSITTTTTTTTT